MQHVIGMARIVMRDFCTSSVRENALAEARAFGASIRDYLSSKGFQIHKEEAGIGFRTCIGVTMTDSPYTLRPAPEKFLELVMATTALVQLGACQVDVMRRIVGLWTWHMLLLRGFYSCLHAVVNPGLPAFEAGFLIHWTQRNSFGTGQADVMTAR